MFLLNMKRALIAGGAAAVLGIGAIGVAAAQQTPTPSRTPGPSGTPHAQAQAHAKADQFLEALAKRLGVTTDKLKQALQDARKDAGLPERGHGQQFGPGPMGHGPRPGHGGPPPGPAILRDALQAAVKAIGITPDQLRQELPGKSLSDVAKAHNADPKKVADAIKAELNSHIDQAVSSGKLAADRAAQMKQKAAEHVDAQMTRQVPQRPASDGHHASPPHPAHLAQPGHPA